MDLKILKQDICTNCEVYSTAAEYSIDTEITLPDYCQKISRILKCSAVPQLLSKNIAGNTFSVEGNVCIRLMYVSEGGELASAEHIIPFSKAFESEKELSGCYAECRLKQEYLNCRVAAENRVELHGAIGINLKLLKRNNNCVVSDVSGGGVMLNIGSVPATTPIGKTEKYMNIEELLELSLGQPSVTSVLRYEATAVNTDCKIISGKIAVKGELKVFILYCSDASGTPQSFKTSVPYSQIIEMGSLGEDCECSCETSVACIEVKPRTSITGEVRSFALSGKLCFAAEASCNNDIPVVYDAFSTKYDANINKQDIRFEKIMKSMNTSAVFRKKLELSAISVGNIIDMWCEPEVLSCSFQNGNLSISGNMKLNTLAFDSDNQPIYFERDADYDYTCAISEELPDNIKCSVKVTGVKLSYTIVNNAYIEITAELSFHIVLLKSYTIETVENISLDEATPKSKSGDAALIIYYADKGEKVWDIARKYNSSPTEISEINSIEAPMLDKSKTLLIPVK